jgi:maleamate amidohydrolase
MVASKLAPVMRGRESFGSPPRKRAPRIGFGVAPGVLVIDFARGWTDPLSEFSLSLDPQLESAALLLGAARAAGAPVIYTTVAYDSEELDAVPMLRKTPRVAAMRRGSWLTEIDPRVAPADADLVLTKKHASAFFGTSLGSLLAARGIDTLLIAGCITSGCVRATAVDAAQHGFRALVVEDAVGDRSAEMHAASLRSIDELYGDVVSLREALAALRAHAPSSPR